MRVATERMMIAALVEAPAGMGVSLATWLQKRTGCSRPTAVKYATMRTGLRPYAERLRLIEQAASQRAAELAAGLEPSAMPESAKDLMRRTEEEAGYAAVAAA